MADAINSTEIWKDIPGFEGCYQVSSFGNLKRLPHFRKTNEGRSAKLSARVWPGSRADGYYKVNWGGHKKYVHQLVCQAFHGDPPEGKNQVSHIDGNKANNRAENLRWADWKDNRADGAKNGEIKRGEDHGAANLTTNDVMAIRKEYADRNGERGCINQMAKRYGLHRSHVRDIIIRRIWRHI